MNIPTTFNHPAMTFVHILIIIIAASIITRLIAYLMNRMDRFKKDMTAIYLIRDIINYIIYFIALMVIYNSLELTLLELF